jgi:plasmid stabilization system protein ParE
VNHYRFLREALDEYEDAIEYYERAQSGLGDTFIRDVEHVLAVTLEFTEIGVLVADTPAELNVRRRIVQRFGVEIDYVAVGDEVIVLAIFHCKRRPGYWRDRLDSIKPK